MSYCQNVRCFERAPCPLHQVAPSDRSEAKSQSLSDLLESDEAMRAQFDRSHPTFHKGDVTPVPVADSWLDKRVPTSMAGPEVLNQESTEEPDSYGPEYDAIMKARMDLTEMKRCMNVVNRCIGVMLTDLTNPQFQKEKEDAVAAVAAFEDRFDVDSEWRADIRSFVQEASGESADLAKNIALLNTTVTRKIGFEQKRQLARIKDIKTAWKAAHAQP